MDRRQLEHFLAICARGSFTSAASALHVAQPSLSHSIRGLERELGTQLFHRLGRGVRLTPEGEALLPRAQEVVRAFGHAHAAVQDVQGLEAGRLDIAAVTALAVDPLAELTGQFRRAHPGIDVRVHDAESGARVQALVRGGECEIGLSDAPSSSGGLAMVELPGQEMLVVLPPDAGLPEGPLNLADLAGLDLIVTPPGSSARLMLDQVLARIDARLRVAVETPHWASIVPLVVAGAGAALLPRPMAEVATDGRVRVAGTDPPMVRRVIVFSRPRDLSRPAAAFMELASATAD